MFVSDVCSLPKDPGPCGGYYERYYYDSESGICKPFVYGGCLGNGNNFKTLQECLGQCVPGMPLLLIYLLGV